MVEREVLSVAGLTYVTAAISRIMLSAETLTRRGFQPCLCLVTPVVGSRRPLPDLSNLNRCHRMASRTRHLRDRCRIGSRTILCKGGCQRGILMMSRMCPSENPSENTLKLYHQSRNAIEGSATYMWKIRGGVQIATIAVQRSSRTDTS